MAPVIVQLSLYILKIKNNVLKHLTKQKHAVFVLHPTQGTWPFFLTMALNSQKVNYRTMKRKMLMDRGYFGIYLGLYISTIAVLYVAFFVNKSFKMVLKPIKSILFLFSHDHK